MSETAEHAIILFAHGARDERWSETLSQLRGRVQRALPNAHVSTAFLEFQSPSLVEVLGNAERAGCTRIDVVPIFWASGGHVANDVPPLIESFRAAHPDVQLRLLPVISELPGLLDFIAAAVVDAGQTSDAQRPTLDAP